MHFRDDLGVAVRRVVDDENETIAVSLSLVDFVESAFDPKFFDEVVFSGDDKVLVHFPAQPDNGLGRLWFKELIRCVGEL